MPREMECSRRFEVACRRVKLKAIFNINIMKGGMSQEISVDKKLKIYENVLCSK